jgi:DNA-directed RNA polymerase specialized sigma24 family protein
MTPPARRPRADPSFERLYRRHVAGVYRYALAVLHDPEVAEEVTRATFLKANRAYQEGERPRRARGWLIDIAHDLCRERDSRSKGPPADAADGDDRPGREPPEGPLACNDAQLAGSKHLDGRLPRAERPALRAHLRACDECADLVRRHRAHRRTFKTLAAVAPPPSLVSFTSGTRGFARISVVAIAAAGLLVAGGAYAAFGRGPSRTTEARAQGSPAKSGAPPAGALEMRRERAAAPVAARAVRSRPRRAVKVAKKPAANHAAKPKAHRSPRRHASKRPKSSHVHVHARAHARPARPALAPAVASAHAARPSVALPTRHVLHLTSRVSKPKK